MSQPCGDGSPPVQPPTSLRSGKDLEMNAESFAAIGTNTGHGHVWKRPDGVKARCGGPGICRECARDFALLNRSVQKGADTTAADLIEVMKGQLLIVFLKRLGGEIRIPVSEVDDTGGDLFALAVEGSDFVFKVTRKN